MLHKIINKTSNGHFRTKKIKYIKQMLYFCKQNKKKT